MKGVIHPTIKRILKDPVLRKKFLDDHKKLINELKTNPELLASPTKRRKKRRNFILLLLGL